MLGQSQFEHARQQRLSLDLPYELKQRLLLLQNIILKDLQLSTSQEQLSKYQAVEHYLPSLKSLNLNEKIGYYILFVDLVQESKKGHVPKSNFGSTPYTFNCFYKDEADRLNWQKTTIRIDMNICKATLLTPKNILLDLQKYIAKKNDNLNHKNLHSFQLLATAQTSPDSLTIGFDRQQDMVGTFELFRKAIDMALHKYIVARLTNIVHFSSEDSIAMLSTSNTINLKDTTHNVQVSGTQKQLAQSWKEMQAVDKNSLIDLIEQQEGLDLVRSGPTYKITKSNTNFRLTMNVPKPKESLLNVLANPENYHLWNNRNIYGCIIHRDPTINCVSAIQRIQGYPPVELLFTRHLFNLKGRTNIWDLGVQKNKFQQCIWSLREQLNGRMTELTVQIDIPALDAESTIKYLEQMARIDYYLAKQPNFNTKCSEYFNVEWPLVPYTYESQLIDSYIVEPNDQLFNQRLSTVEEEIPKQQKSILKPIVNYVKQNVTTWARSLLAKTKHQEKHKEEKTDMTLTLTDTTDRHPSGQQSEDYIRVRAQLWPIKYPYETKKSHFTLPQKRHISYNDHGVLVCRNLGKMCPFAQYVRQQIKINPKFACRSILHLPDVVQKKVTIFQNITQLLTFLPLFVQRALKEPSAIERVKILMGMCFGATVQQLGQAVPCAAQVGQTFQCWLNGCPAYFQALTHDKIAVLFIGRGYRVHGRLQHQLEANRLMVKQHFAGNMKIEFESYSMGCVEYHLAPSFLLNLDSETPECTILGKSIVYDSSKNIYAETDFDMLKKGNYRVQFYQKNALMEDIRGSVRQGLKSRERIIDFNVDKPCLLSREKYPLRSDITNQFDY